MSYQTKLSVCRQISLNIASSDWETRGEPVIANLVPDTESDIASFVKLILPDRKIEHLGRQNMIYLEDLNSSSLFFQAVHHCFQNHYPFAIRPEVLMFMIAHEIATTVKMYPEHYQDIFTNSSSDKKVDIRVRHDGLQKGNPSSPWGAAIPMFKQALEPHVPSSIMNDMMPKLSTTTLEAQIAMLVAFMDAASPYYNYHTYTKCGIPEIRLLGVCEDYLNILQAVKRLEQIFSVHLSLYFEHLIPVLETLYAQAKGAELDEDFWMSMYKFQSESGTDTFNGWLTTFVNYVNHVPYSDRGNPELKQKNANLYDWTHMRGLIHGSVPSQVSSVPFVWHYFEEEFDMFFLGGVLGIDNVDGYVTPLLSYGVVNA